jgi:STE24 endopeptidase
MFFTFGFCQSDPRLATDFGYDAPCTFLTLQTFLTLYSSLVSPFFSIALNAFTRQLEFAADAYSVSLGYDIRGSLAKISKTNLSDLNPDPLDSLCHHSHPTTVQRVTAVEALLDKKGTSQSAKPKAE